MEYQHFIGEGPEAEALIQQVMTKTKEFNDAVDALETKTGLKFWGTQKGIGGPQMEEGLDDAEARKRGIKYMCRFPEKDHIRCYLPHMGTKAGKAMQAEIDKINRLHCNANDLILSATKMGRMVFSGGMMAMSAAGFINGKIAVKVPLSGRDGGDDPMPIHPDWLRPAKESEVLALFGK